MGQSTNFIDIFPDYNPEYGIRRSDTGDPDNPDYNVFLHRGIRLGSTLKEVYGAYGVAFTRRFNIASIDNEAHTSTTQVVLHYGIKERDICYQISILFDQNDVLMYYCMVPHPYH